MKHTLSLGEKTMFPSLISEMAIPQFNISFDVVNPSGKNCRKPWFAPIIPLCPQSASFCKLHLGN